jgi:hypothetical protein
VPRTIETVIEQAKEMVSKSKSYASSMSESNAVVRNSHERVTNADRLQEEVVLRFRLAGEPTGCAFANNYPEKSSRAPGVRGGRLP